MWPLEGASSSPPTIDTKGEGKGTSPLRAGRGTYPAGRGVRQVGEAGHSRWPMADNQLFPSRTSLSGWWFKGAGVVEKLLMAAPRQPGSYRTSCPAPQMSSGCGYGVVCGVIPTRWLAAAPTPCLPWVLAYFKSLVLQWFCKLRVIVSEHFFPP